MNVITSIESASRIRREVVLSIGNFDGLHRAHSRILEWTVRQARKTGAEAWALTFSNHPLEILKGKGPRLLTTAEEKLEYFRQAGLTGVLLVPFTRRFSRLRPQDFLGLLARAMRIRFICVGDNFLFGSANRGDPGLMARTGKKLGFLLKTFPVLKDGKTGTIISSSAIRGLLAKGRVEEARRLLGRPYSLTAAVVKGKRLGRRLGFPTLNFDLDEVGKSGKAVPHDGVYRTETVIEGRKSGRWPGLTYIGRKFPTKSRTIETHLSGFRSDAYGLRATVRFLEFVRKPKVFRTEGGLRTAVRKDIEGR